MRHASFLSSLLPLYLILPSTPFLLQPDRTSEETRNEYGFNEGLCQRMIHYSRAKASDYPLHTSDLANVSGVIDYIFIRLVVPFLILLIYISLTTTRIEPGTT